MFGGVGDKTATDLNQYVHSWLDDLERRVRAILDDYQINFTVSFKRKEK